MKELIFLLEEPSMKILLDKVLPQILPDDIFFFTIAHNGKSDLMASIPRKIRGWRKENTHFIILHDKDSNDCFELKKQLSNLCVQADRPDSLIRIVCSELESWFLGDLPAVSSAYNLKNLEKRKSASKFRNPDNLSNASQELKKIAKEYQKLSGARMISEKMDIYNNSSQSFNVFIEGIKKLLYL